MGKKSLIKYSKIDFKLATPEEIGQILASRLQQQRLVKNWTQQELAERTGLTRLTIINFENGQGQASIMTLNKILIALDLAHELEPLFLPKISSIAEMEALENIRNGAGPMRAGKKSK